MDDLEKPPYDIMLQIFIVKEPGDFMIASVAMLEKGEGNEPDYLVLPYKSGKTFPYDEVHMWRRLDDPEDRGFKQCNEFPDGVTIFFSR